MLKPPKTSPTVQKDRSEAAEEAMSTAYVRSRNFIDENRAMLIAAAVGIVVIFLGVLGFIFWQRGQAVEANERLAEVLPVYQQGDFEAALEDDGQRLGLFSISNDYRRTPGGRLAAFYAGHALFQLERFEEAEEYFQRYSGDAMLEASALAGRAAAAEEREDFSRAARLFEDAARAHPSAATAPDNLMNAGRNHELAGNMDSARRAYERIESDFPDTPAAANVPIHLSRLDALAQAE